MPNAFAYIADACALYEDWGIQVCRCAIENAQLHMKDHNAITRVEIGLHDNE